MKKYYCNGKKGFCDRYNGETEPNCNGCEFADGTGGNVIQSTTNYDRIRNMSVEEMAKYIDDYDDRLGGEICCWYCEKTTGKKYRCPYGEEERDSKCIECIIEWLNSEVEEK